LAENAFLEVVWHLCIKNAFRSLITPPYFMELLIRTLASIFANLKKIEEYVFLLYNEENHAKKVVIIW